ncbi:capsid protein [Pacific flying fox faeces associated gemycircularvirus-6]|uniref:Capsid protein n=1 Tax=Pacific flying fox faeces associated gemycircularvirus-6 TaxID=1795998 RepID=A0A140CTM9_9VIRU|nr:capsid protein [Pacific flying fox faeces associated gemycircularvirus-6]
MPYYSRRRRYGHRRQYGRKRVLNITSRKKQDTMLPFTNTTASAVSGGTTFTNQAAVLVGGNTYVFPWCCTARDNTINGSPATVFATAARTATGCYMRGLKERIQIQTNTGMPWQWRRICFTLKGDVLTQYNETAYKIYDETSDGWSRIVSNTGVASNLATAVQNLVFAGQQGKDWTAVFNAKVDDRRLTLKYDKTVYIRSGNASGVMRDYHRWHPMNANLVYDDDEAGTSMVPSYFSPEGRAGMGDYYVLDIIAGGSGATSSDQLTFNPQTTLYWHER